MLKWTSFLGENERRRAGQTRGAEAERTRNAHSMCSEAFPTEGIGRAIMNRMDKAAGHRHCASFADILASGDVAKLQTSE
jgi:hypothetical protein